jgi:hypothetical protein
MTPNGMTDFAYRELIADARERIAGLGATLPDEDLVRRMRRRRADVPPEAAHRALAEARKLARRDALIDRLIGQLGNGTEPAIAALVEDRALDEFTPACEPEDRARLRLETARALVEVACQRATERARKVR